MSTAFEFDPFDPEQTQTLWPRFREIREHYPISRPGDFVFVARYRDAVEVLRQPELFSNGQGFRAAGVDVPLEDRLVGELDPPHHRPIRRLLTKILVPATAEQVAPFTRRMADAALDRIIAAGTGDLVSDLTLLLPTQVTVKVLGLPVEDAEQLAAWANDLMHSDWPALNRTERGEGLQGAFPEYASYIDRHVAARRNSSPSTGDTLARLVHEEVFGAPISDRQLRALVSNLLLGGISTSTSMLGNIFHYLLTHSEHLTALRESPRLIPAAVEESLRLHPPILYVMRTCMERTKLSGFEIRAGERIIVSIASANRDDAIFPDADSFLLDRNPKQHAHLSFSGGPHLCLGASLARMVGSIVTSAFCERFDAVGFALEDDFSFEPTPVFMEFGPAHLPVRVLRSRGS